MPLNTAPNFHRPGTVERHAHENGDAFYATLVAAHSGLTDAQSEQLHARLLLLLANHIGDRDVLEEAINLARNSV
jgi:Protein of unknown function (DUF2783)